MSTRQKLSESEITIRLGALNGWEVRDSRLVRNFKFGGFSEAFAFMTRVALAAESMNHHPDWSNVWNQVSVSLQTHDVGGLTDLDFRLAEKMNSIAAS